MILKETQNIEIVVVWGSAKVTGNVSIRQSAYDFPFDLNGNYASILYRFGVMRVIGQKSPILTYPHLHLAPPLGWPRSNFADVWRQKTIVPGLSCSVARVIQCLALLIQYRRVDYETDGWIYDYS